MSKVENRREFLKLIGIGGLSAASALLYLFKGSEGKTLSKDSDKWAILFDATKCVGCKACQAACKEWNQLEPIKTQKPGFENPEHLSKDVWLTMKFKEIEGKKEIKWVYSRWACMHCEEPVCLSVCPTGAIYKRPDGIVWIHEDRCFGCYYCMVACPYNVRFFDETKGYVVKCKMCFDRIEQGLEPACVETCPSGALEFGKRNEIIATARKRAREIGGYVYGDEEKYGNSVIYVSEIPFEKLGFPSLERRIPATEALSKILVEKGGLGLFGAAALAFFSFVFWRRSVLKEVMKKEIPRK